MNDPNEILDGFGHSVSSQVQEGFAMAVLYGAAPPGLGGSGGGIGTDWDPNKFKPPDPPPPNPKPFTLTVRGPDGFELKLSLTPEEWEQIRPAILGAVK
ncbi:hypothetical protein EHM76_01305 [bacterium]|nr:MAG: hypothetical protein EHM76_01305 [bacterium]